MRAGLRGGRMFHGGAGLAPSAARGAVFPDDEETETETEAGRRVGAFAARLMEPVERIVIDAGPIAYAFAQAIPEDFAGCVITHSMPVPQLFDQRATAARTVALGVAPGPRQRRVQDRDGACPAACSAGASASAATAARSWAGRSVAGPASSVSIRPSTPVARLRATAAASGGASPGSRTRWAGAPGGAGDSCASATMAADDSHTTTPQLSGRNGLTGPTPARHRRPVTTASTGTSTGDHRRSIWNLDRRPGLTASGSRRQGLEGAGQHPAAGGNATPVLDHAASDIDNRCDAPASAVGPPP